jgi:GAF domain-containing protein
MPSSTPFEDSLHALSQFLVGTNGMDVTLQRVSELTASAIGGADFVSLTLLDRGEPVTAAFTDPAAPVIDQAQYETGRGPCVECAATGVVLWIDSTHEDDRWPEFAQACVDHGVLSTLSLPLWVDGTPIGAMNLYARSQAAFTEGDRLDATRFARQSAIVVANAWTHDQVRRQVEQLREALDTRAVIEQAKGVVMAAMRCSAEEAFETLRRQSQHENRKLRDVAGEIVRNLSRPT